MKNKTSIIGTCGIALGVGLGIVACGGSSPAHTTQVQHTTQSCPAQVHAWLHGPGGQEWNVVQSDLNTMTSAVSNDAATGSEGATLSADASSAEANPVPACADAASYYTYAMADLVTTGNDVQSGDVSDAVTQISASTTEFNSLTAEIKGDG